jgi:hypothetical protein
MADITLTIEDIMEGHPSVLQFLAEVFECKPEDFLYFPAWECYLHWSRLHLFTSAFWHIIPNRKDLSPVFAAALREYLSRLTEQERQQRREWFMHLREVLATEEIPPEVPEPYVRLRVSENSQGHYSAVIEEGGPGL